MTWRLFLTYLTWLFLSFEDRLPRMGFWLGGLVAALMSPLFVLLFFAPLRALSSGQWSSSSGTLPAMLIILIAGAALSTKRAHDRGKSAGYGVGLFVACFAVVTAWNWIVDALPNEASSISFQIAGAALCVWYLVEFGFLRGTEGPNAYGGDPLTEEPLRRT